MTQRRSAALAVAFSLFTCAAIPAVASVDDNNAISLTITDTSSVTASPSVSTTPATRRYHKKTRRVSRATTGRMRSNATSRGITGSPVQATKVMGRLGVVASETAQILGGRERYGRVLSTVPKGTNLALAGETDTQYAVLMIDRTYGFVNKADVQLLDYQVVSNSPAPTDPAGGPSDGSLGARMVQTASSYMNVPYVWGGETRDGIDCSGFVKAVYDTYGIRLPRHSGDQANVGADVPKERIDQWVPGDRLYFACHHPEIDHTGMYVGNGWFIHSHGGHGVGVTRVDDPYYYKHLVCVRRSRELFGETSLTASAQTPSQYQLPPKIETNGQQTAIDSDGDPEAGQQ